MKNIFVIKILINSFSDFRKDEGNILATSISFNFILSSIPFTVLLGSLMGYFFEYFQKTQNISTKESSVIILEYIKNIFPMVKEEALLQLFNIQNYKLPLSIIGIIGLIFTSTLLFEAIKYSFLKILNSADTHFLITRLVGFLIIFIIILISFFLENFLSLFIIELKTYLENISFLNWILETFEVYGFVISLGVTIIFSFTLYYTFIRIFARYKSYTFKTILMGSFFFSIIWNLFKNIYTIYLSKVSYLNLIYGSFTSLVIIFIWVYFTTTLFLFSLELIKNIHKEIDY
ncbi:MAG: YihY/virulence factor BrkB family protein [Candidatus Mcinerneyibacterium aminivorans]|uniref:YihY/virulence factor BrkB family protein n=1 Tax=Candidatus Mcinerneyibacterium aminivorans TaxID=2703815 RepID=A0A5D0MBE5_9BACT|nr:MAG: YihY/virulence factor BrkB family protein [Candidatus Mcinerneyibacterium aminivorans]